MKNAFSAILAPVLLFTACNTTEPIVQSDPAPLEVAFETYTWEKYGLSFQVGDGLQVSNPWDGDLLIVDEADYNAFEGELLGQIRIFPTDKSSIDEVVQDAKEDHDLSISDDVLVDEGEREFMEEEVTFGGNTYTKITSYSLFGDIQMEDYLIENNGVIYQFSKGADEHETAMKIILETLSFE